MVMKITLKYGNDVKNDMQCKIILSGGKKLNKT